MDDGFGDILYVILMIIAFLVSVIAKFKKSSGAEKQVTVPVDDENEPISTLEDFFNKVENIKPPKEVSKPVEKVVTNKTEILKEQKKRSNSTKRETVFIKSDVEDSFWDDESFDLRKAVIFSEILKRPDY